MIITRVLRGRLLYVCIGVLAFLYVRAFAMRLSEPPAPVAASPPQTSEAMEWWPSQVDIKVLQRVAGERPALAASLSLLSLLMGGLAFGGLGLTIWAVWSGHIQGVWRFTRRQLPPWSLGELGRIIVLILALALPLARHALLPIAASDTRAWMSVSMFLLDLLIVLLIAAFASGKSESIWRTFGFGRPRFGRLIGAGLRGYVGVFPWLFILLSGMIELSRRIGWQPPAEPIQELIFQEHRPAVLGVTVLLACLLGPVAEELFFRGVLYAALRRHATWTSAMLLSAGLFALVHTNVLGFLPIMLLGCLLANLYERTGSLAVPIAVHVLHNTLLMALALVFRQLLAAAV